jgi:hypothetical protein
MRMGLSNQQLRVTRAAAELNGEALNGTVIASPQVIPGSVRVSVDVNGGIARYET